MTLPECEALLERALEMCDTAAPAGTPLCRTGETVLTMARAYRSDGAGFARSGDPVNALAAFLYGSGWLHFGITYGLIGCRRAVSCPFEQVPALPDDPVTRAKLKEKTERYSRLLDTARTSIVPQGEGETAGYSFSQKVLCIAAVYAGEGIHQMDAGSHERALACFSYAHGWIDAAVTAGLFSIAAHREMFTV
jgi:hypothetical protein